MRFALTQSWLTELILVSIRVGGVFAITPILSVARVPVRFRVLWQFALAVVLIAGMGPKSYVAPQSLGGLVSAAASELFVGALLGFGALAAFAAFQLAGRIIDIQMGFGVAGLIDPATRASTPLLGTFLNLTAVMVFFAIDGHHLLIRGLAFSFEHVPLGAGLAEFNFAAVLAQFGSMFVYAIALVAPVLVTLLLLDIALGVVARTMPQVNVFIVSIPIKIFVGLLVLVLSLQYSGPLMKDIFESVFRFWEQVLG